MSVDTCGHPQRDREQKITNTSSPLTSVHGPAPGREDRSLYKLSRNSYCTVRYVETPTGHPTLQNSLARLRKTHILTDHRSPCTRHTSLLCVPALASPAALFPSACLPLSLPMWGSTLYLHLPARAPSSASPTPSSSRSSTPRSITPVGQPEAANWMPGVGSTIDGAEKVVRCEA